MSKVLHNFKTGPFATYLESKIKEKIRFTNGGYLIPKTFSHNKVIEKNNIYTFQGKDEEFILFAYKERYYTKKYKGLPRLHVTSKCKTREQYSGFTFTNKLPVNIISRDENKTYYNQHLKICKNCTKEVRTNLLRFGSETWFDFVLKQSNKREYANSDIANNNYVRNWKQLSEAYRTKKKYKCEFCGIDLSDDPYYLEVHHKNRNRLDNNENNLQALCVKCHSKKHPGNYNYGDNYLKLDSFKEKYK